MTIVVNVEENSQTEKTYPKLMVYGEGVVWLAFDDHRGVCLNSITGRGTFYENGTTQRINFNDVGWSDYTGEITLKNGES